MSNSKGLQLLLKRIMLLVLYTVSCSALALDDPMRPPSTRIDTTQKSVRSTAPAFNLTSTLVAEGRRVAVINGRSLEVGDKINGARVEAILPARVKLRVAGKSRYIRLIPLTVKIPSKGTPP